MFVTGGLTGIMFVAIPFDQQVTDTYFVVAHFHYIIFGAAVFPIFGGMYYWFPKVTGQHVLRAARARSASGSSSSGRTSSSSRCTSSACSGCRGASTRIPDGLGWTAYNLAETIGGFVTLAGILLLLGNLVVSYLRGPPAGPDPWHGPTLEWTTSSPPPEYNFAVIPTVSSAVPELGRRRPRGATAASSSDGVLVLDEGHEQPAVDAGRRRASSEIVRDAARVAVADRCSRSRSSLVFAMLVIEQYGVGGDLRASSACSRSSAGTAQEPQEQ